jgi:glycerophosphoryl diester phosphodiesterase
MHNVAHRGYSWVAPENTLPALVAAVPAGATFVEFDVRTTLDGVPVVIHDKSVDRTTDGSGFVWDLTVDEVRALDAGSWFSAAFTGVRVPLLTEVLDAVGAPLLLEIKRPATADQVKTIIGLVAERGILDRTVVQSFDPDIVRMVREVAPDVPRGLLRLSLDDETVPLAVELGVAYVNPPVLDVARFAELYAAGVAVLPWTANDITRWPGLRAAGVAGLITDRPGELTGYLSERLPGGLG